MCEARSAGGWIAESYDMASCCAVGAEPRRAVAWIVIGNRNFTLQHGDNLPRSQRFRTFRGWGIRRSQPMQGISALILSKTDLQKP